MPFSRHYYAAENPQNVHERPLHSPRVTVWCAVSKKLIIGPYFYEKRGNTVTLSIPSVTWTWLITSWNQNCAKESKPSIRSNVRFQQDGHLLTLPPPQWMSYVRCSPIASSRVLGMCIGPLGHLTWLYAIFSFGDILSHVFMHQNFALWMTLRIQLERKFQ